MDRGGFIISGHFTGFFLWRAQLGHSGFHSRDIVPGRLGLHEKVHLPI